jgi:hypothetical protein
MRSNYHSPYVNTLEWQSGDRFLLSVFSPRARPSVTCGSPARFALNNAKPLCTAQRWAKISSSLTMVSSWRRKLARAVGSDHATGCAGTRWTRGEIYLEVVIPAHLHLLPLVPCAILFRAYTPSCVHLFKSLGLHLARFRSLAHLSAKTNPSPCVPTCSRQPSLG